MREYTDLEGLKRVATLLLHIEPESHPEMTFIVYHPYFNSPFQPLENEDGYKVVNIMEGDNFSKICERFKEVINECENAKEIFSLANKSYMPTFMKYLHKYLGKGDFENILKKVWLNTEFPNHDANITVTEFLELFKKCDKKLLMEESEFDVLNNLPDEVTIYRGCYAKYKKALSWTLSKEKAIWFSTRFTDSGYVYQASIPKCDIIAYFNERNEQEVIPDIKKLKNLKQL